jgi:hypothetical protein
MRVRYTLPVHGTLRKETDEPIVLNDYRFEFVTDPLLGFIKELVVEISGIPNDQWPTLTAVEQDASAPIPRFPFETNKNTLRFSQIESHLRNLENYLSVFGFGGIEFSRLKEEWLPDASDELAPMMQGFSIQKAELEPVFKPLSDEILARCIAASNSKEEETLHLAYFRVAQSNFSNEFYIEAFKFSYLCLECLFSNGQTKNGRVSEEFSKSQELCEHVRRLFLDNSYRPFEVLRLKYENLRATNDAPDVLGFFVKLRGRLQHANLHPSQSWHPSKQTEFRNEAICIYNVAAEICFSRAIAKIGSVQ